MAHVGIVVKDCRKAAEWYTKMFGIGPWDINDYDMAQGKYFHVDGKPAKPKFRAAFAWSGNVALELVEVLEGETPHTRFLSKHGEGVQHVCFYVTDMEAVMQKLEGEGLRPILDYEFETTYDGKRSRIKEVYLSSGEEIGGTTLQLLQVDPL